MTEALESHIVIERRYRAELAELWALWTTKEGFESWWGPKGFHVEVREMDARPGGRLHYAMIADTPEMVAAMDRMCKPVSTECRGHFSAFVEQEKLALTQVIDFLPGVPAYDSLITVEFRPAADGEVRMIVTLSQMHDATMTDMQRMGFTSQLAKLDDRYGRQG